MDVMLARQVLLNCGAFHDMGAGCDGGDVIDACARACACWCAVLCCAVLCFDLVGPTPLCGCGSSAGADLTG